jgi:hypothetical protein
MYRQMEGRLGSPDLPRRGCDPSVVTTADLDYKARIFPTTVHDLPLGSRAPPLA